MVTAKPVMQELGIIPVEGIDLALNLFDNTVPKDEEITSRDFRRMLRVDGHSRGLYSVLSSPITSTKSYIEPFDRRSLTEARFVEKNLFSPPALGGMSKSFTKVKSTMARMLIDGFAPHEIVWKLIEDKIIVDKIAYRPPETCHAKVDEHGEFNGFKQKGTINGKFVNVEISKNKALWFTFNQAFNHIYGQSAFHAAYSHYQKKHKLYYISHIAAQINATGIRVVKAPDSSDDISRENYLKSAAKIGFNAAFLLLPGWELEIQNIGVPQDLLPYIQHHNTEMSISTVSQFMDLGTEGNSSSRSLSENHVTMFIDQVSSILTIIEDIINNELIPQLIDFNFTSKKYPKFRYESINRFNLQILKDLYIRVASSRFVNSSKKMFMALEQNLEDRLGLNLELTEEDYKHVDRSANDQKPEVEEKETPFEEGDEDES